MHECEPKRTATRFLTLERHALSPPPLQQHDLSTDAGARPHQFLLRVLPELPPERRLVANLDLLEILDQQAVDFVQVLHARLDAAQTLPNDRRQQKGQAQIGSQTDAHELPDELVHALADMVLPHIVSRIDDELVPVKVDVVQRVGRLLEQVDGVAEQVLDHAAHALPEDAARVAPALASEGDLEDPIAVPNGPQHV